MQAGSQGGKETQRDARLRSIMIYIKTYITEKKIELHIKKIRFEAIRSRFVLFW